MQNKGQRNGDSFRSVCWKKCKVYDLIYKTCYRKIFRAKIVYREVLVIDIVEVAHRTSDGEG